MTFAAAELNRIVIVFRRTPFDFIQPLFIHTVEATACVTKEDRHTRYALLASHIRAILHTELNRHGLNNTIKRQSDNDFTECFRQAQPPARIDTQPRQNMPIDKCRTLFAGEPCKPLDLHLRIPVIAKSRIDIKLILGRGIAYLRRHLLDIIRTVPLYNRPKVFFTLARDRAYVRELSRRRVLMPRVNVLFLDVSHAKQYAILPHAPDNRVRCLLIGKCNNRMSLEKMCGKE